MGSPAGRRAVIELLVDRLRWPAALVRERAASQIGSLIAGGDEEASEALIAWISRQELESLAAVGLLPFLYAAMQGGTGLPATDVLVSACRSPSVLSELYLRELDPARLDTPSRWQHAGVPPPEWEPPVVEHGAHLPLPEERLRERLHVIEKYYLVPLTRHFEFEVWALSRRHGSSLAVDHGAQGSSDRGYHPVWFTLASEIRLSAFLRTLAWASEKNTLPPEFVRAEAAVAAPVDLGLWRVAPTVPPSWWPRIEPSDERAELESEAAKVVRTVELAVESWQSEEEVVLAASGCIASAKLSRHDIQVRSFFQRPIGPVRPMSSELFDFAYNARARVSKEASPLRFEGLVTLATEPGQLKDWQVLPCSGWSSPATSNVWQAWRMVRGIQCPVDLLANGEVHMTCCEDSVDFTSEGELVGRWRDWSQDMSSLFVKDLPPSSGWALVAPRSVIDRFSRETGAKLGWAWEITSRSRDYSHQDFAEQKTHGQRGGSSVIRP